MIPKTEERIRNKIDKIKKALKAGKDHWGGFYDDGQGIRYFPPKHYIQLGDYPGEIRYLN